MCGPDSDAGVKGEIKEFLIRISFRISFLFLLFVFRFSFFLWIKLGFFLLFPFAFVFFPLITHICFSLFEYDDNESTSRRQGHHREAFFILSADYADFHRLNTSLVAQVSAFAISKALNMTMKN